MHELVDGKHESNLREPKDQPQRAHDRLAAKVARTLGSRAGGHRIVRVAEPLEEAPHPLRWLGAQPASEKVYWSGRESGTRVAAAGVADLASAASPDGYAALQERIESSLAGSGARYYGGLRFDPDAAPAGAWGPFGAYRFVLPRLELVVGDGGAELACNLVLTRDAGRESEILDAISRSPLPSGVPSGGMPLPISRLDSPDRAGWDLNVRQALSSFGRGELAKVVLARRAEFTFAGELDPELLLANLEAATPGCFHFSLRPEGGPAFVGASPERLYRREGREVVSEAVAGTLPRGDSEESDEALRRQLLGSDKLRREQGYVREGIQEALHGLCDDLEVEEGVSEMKLTSRRHLVSGFRGTLREGVSDAGLLAALSPTPAVGGDPRGEAMRLIRELEPFDRGLYAGPVGWIGADSAEFAVGIRSGLVDGDRLALYSGNGIVRGSEPEEEWREIEQKISDFAVVLGLDLS